MATGGECRVEWFLGAPTASRQYQLTRHNSNEFDFSENARRRSRNWLEGKTSNFEVYNDRKFAAGFH